MKRVLLLISPLILLLTPSCVVDRTAESRSFNLMKEMYTNKNMIKLLRKKVEKEINELKDKTESMEETYRLSRKNLADSSVLLDNIRAEFYEIKGKMDEILHTLDDMEKKGAKDKEDIEFKILDLNARLSILETMLGVKRGEATSLSTTKTGSVIKIETGSSEQIKGIADESGNKKASSAESAKGALQPSEGEVILSEEEHFEKGFNLYKAREFDRAILVLKEFIKRFPKSKKADDALLLIGDSYMEKKEYITAITELQKLVDRYPKSGNICKAIFKQGLSFKNLAKNEEAKVFFNDLISKCPSSEEAKKAKKILKEIK